MIEIEVMEKSKGKILYIEFVDGEIWKNRKCTNFYFKDDDDEENMLEFGNVLVNQSEIKKLEILDWELCNFIYDQKEEVKMIGVDLWKM